MYIYFNHVERNMNKSAIYWCREHYTFWNQLPVCVFIFYNLFAKGILEVYCGLGRSGRNPSCDVQNSRQRTAEVYGGGVRVGHSGITHDQVNYWLKNKET